MSGALAGRSAGTEGNKGRVETTKVKRYRPGQVPEWMRTDDQLDVDLPFGQPVAATAATAAPPGEAVRRTGVAAPVIVKKVEDPRLARLAAAIPVDRESALWERHAAHEREVSLPQVVRRSRTRSSPEAPIPRSRNEEEEGEAREDAGDDAEAIAARRAALRERLRAEEAAAVVVQLEEEREEGSEDKEGGSEYTTDDSDEEDDGFGLLPLAKPVFVPRVSRETVAEREAMEREAEEEAERAKIRLEQRKEETRELVAARLAEEEAQAAAAAAGPKGIEDVDTDDEAADEEEEYDAWRMREMQRIGRDREEREREAKEAAERQRWKHLTEEERAAELAARPKEAAAEKPKKKWGFLQKYYHRGAFFQTEAEWKGEEAPLAAAAALRDFSAPTGADRVDKSMLPAVLQVKDFGRKGRSKWTHLAAEDTTDFASPWAANAGGGGPRRRGGAEDGKNVFTKPKTTKT